ncbi:MAG: hypothetical protein GY797_26460, partial [Deltaproteobacteria bacterium]|nr:hypothetical protein [Deltaproteobacteria bacterium]
MKFKFLSTIIIILVMLLSINLTAGTTYDQTVVKVEYPGVLAYSGSITFVDSASGGIYYTQAMFIGNVNSAAYGWGFYDCSEVGTEDVNVIYEFSNDRTVWTTGQTAADLDALGTTAVLDSIGYEAGATVDDYKAFNWYRIQFV